MILILVFSFVAISEIKVNGQETICLNVQNENAYNGPDYMGVGMGHSSLDGNWVKFMERLGVNSARLFVSPIKDLRKFIGDKWGKNLDGEEVTNSTSFYKAVTNLRTSNGRNSSYSWQNPVRWNEIFDLISQVSTRIYGSDENSINKLKDINVTLLLVLDIKCTIFDFITKDQEAKEYWMERWEFYKYSYALAVWARRKRIEFIEFYNEPDLDLDSCLDSSEFLNIYQIRSLSIQQAYLDINQSEDRNNNKLDPKILASAFARITYNGDLTKYLGELVVNYNNYIFLNAQIQPLWSNMNGYSYHSYGKSGSKMADDIFYLQNSINNDLSRIYSFYKIPLVITEHNSHTSSEWDNIKSTPDNDYEASRLSSQIMNIILSDVKSHYVFKFSITPSFSPTRDVAMNGLHWGEIEQDPFDLSDCTLSSESMRLLATKLIKSKLYPIIDSNDSSKYRNYILVKPASNDINPSLNDDLFYYLYAINDKDENVNLYINFNQLEEVNENTKLIIEEVSKNYWNEVSNIVKLNSSKQISIMLNSYTTMRIAIQKGMQNINAINSTYTCTLRAGFYSNINECNNFLNLVGTSNTINHENTCVSLIKFNLNEISNSNNNLKVGKTLLKINIQDIIINGPFSDMIILILGIKSVPNDWIQSTISWTKLSDTTFTTSSTNNNTNILNKLNSGILINGIYKNFINWSSSSDISIVGHFIIKYDDITKENEKLKERMIDVSDYANKMVNSNLNDLTFILYRPFRYPSYKTGYGNLAGDDLSNGAIIRFYGANSIHSPQLIQYK